MDPVTLAILASMAGGVASAGASSFFGGSSDKHGQRSRLSKKQQPLLQQLIDANMKQGAGGSFGTAADYYRDLMSNDSQTMNQLSAPEMRKFNEEIIPGISEQFAGMGSGGLSSSGFRNAAVGAGTDLSERLGAIRANLRSQGAAGLANLGQIGLGDYTNNTYQQGQPGLFEAAAPGVGEAVTAGFKDYFKTQTPSPSAPTASAQTFNGSQTLPGFLQTRSMPISQKGQSSPYGKGQLGLNKGQLPGFGGY